MAGERWIFTKSQLVNTPSRQNGVDSDKELSYRQQAASLIQDMGKKLQVTQLCINTAIVYMQRFYMFQSFTKFHRHNMASACIFLAAKVEEQPRKLEHVLKSAHVCLNRDAPPLDTKSDAYLEQSQELVVNENILLQSLGFEITVDHPHTHVVKTCQLVRASRDLAQTSYVLATNSLHLTSMCLQNKPTVVACVCIHLACKWSHWEIPRSNEGKDWYWYTDKTVTLDLLEELTQDFLNILEKCPSRLKRKIMTRMSVKEDETSDEKRATYNEADLSSGASKSHTSHHMPTNHDRKASTSGVHRPPSSGREHQKRVSPAPGVSKPSGSGAQRHTQQSSSSGAQRHPQQSSSSYSLDGSVKHGAQGSVTKDHKMQVKSEQTTEPVVALSSSTSETKLRIKLDPSSALLEDDIEARIRKDMSAKQDKRVHPKSDSGGSSSEHRERKERSRHSLSTPEKIKIKLSDLSESSSDGERRGHVKQEPGHSIPQREHKEKKEDRYGGTYVSSVTPEKIRIKLGRPESSSTSGAKISSENCLSYVDNQSRSSPLKLTIRQSHIHKDQSHAKQHENEHPKWPDGGHSKHPKGDSRERHSKSPKGHKSRDPKGVPALSNTSSSIRNSLSNASSDDQSNHSDREARHNSSGSSSRHQPSTNVSKHSYRSSGGQESSDDAGSISLSSTPTSRKRPHTSPVHRPSTASTHRPPSGHGAQSITKVPRLDSLTSIDSHALMQLGSFSDSEKGASTASLESNGRGGNSAQQGRIPQERQDISQINFQLQQLINIRKTSIAKQVTTPTLDQDFLLSDPSYPPLPPNQPSPQSIHTPPPPPPF